MSFLIKGREYEMTQVAQKVNNLIHKIDSTTKFKSTDLFTAHHKQLKFGQMVQPTQRMIAK